MSSHGVTFSEMVGVSLLLCSRKEAVEFSEIKQEMPSPLLVISLNVFRWTNINDDL